MTIRQRVGRILIPAVPLNRRTFNLIRFELNAAATTLLNHISPRLRRLRRELGTASQLRVNLGSGGEGVPGWINIDIGRHHQDQTLPWDIRRGLPFQEDQVAMIFAEHVIEHIEFREDVPRLFREAFRVLETGGRFRIIVPDGERWVKAYVSRDRRDWEALGFPELPQDMPTPMSMLNHVFHQDGEHQFAWDFETLEDTLKKAGFSTVERKAFRESGVDGLALDLSHHAPYSLYLEAVK